MTRKPIREHSSIINMLYFYEACRIWHEILHLGKIDTYALEYLYEIAIYTNFVVGKWRRKICAYFGANI